MPEPIPVVLCFDVEPDEINVGPGADLWLGFEGILERVDGWRASLAAATGRPVRFNWFLRMDPQIADAYGSATWVIDRYGADVERLRAAGDTIGLHPHALRKTSGPGGWVTDHGDPDWVDHCVRTSYEAYAKALGEACRNQRNGDRFLTPRAVRLAIELGAQYDLTVEPGAKAVQTLHPGTIATGLTADMKAAPREPYRPNLDDPRLAGDGSLWMIPMTSMDPDVMLPAWRRVARRVRHLGTPRHRPTTLTAAWPAGPFWSLAERELAAMPQPYLAFAIRTDAPLVPHLIGPIEAKLAALGGSPLAPRLSFTNPAAVVGEART